MRQMEMDVEAIPILKAQVEVYQSDFNAERAAREKIAGEKADLEEEVRRIRQRQQQIADDIEAIPVSFTRHATFRPTLWSFHFQFIHSFQGCPERAICAADADGPLHSQKPSEPDRRHGVPHTNQQVTKTDDS